MKIYIASSWKNQHAVELLTDKLREYQDVDVLSFVENNFDEHPSGEPFEKWILTDKAKQSFDYDTQGASQADLVVYISPSGTDAWAEIGVAWASGKPVWGLYAKGEQSGLMRKMIRWFHDWKELVLEIEGTFLLRKKDVAEN